MCIRAKRAVSGTKAAIQAPDDSWTISLLFAPSSQFSTHSTGVVGQKGKFLHQSVHRRLHIRAACPQSFHILGTSFIHTLHSLSTKNIHLYTGRGGMEVRRPPY